MTFREPGSLVGHDRPRVLIVDDHEGSNQVMTLVLRLRGFPCVAVTNETRALAIIEEFRPDVVILEWASRMDREVERATRIRRAARNKLAIVVVTQEPAAPCPQVLATIDGYFTKPVVLDSLEQTLLRVVSGRADIARVS